MPRLNKKQQQNDINEVMDIFLSYCVEKDLTVKTRNSYRSSILLFSTWLEEIYNITDVTKITKTQIKEYLQDTRERGKYTLTTTTVNVNNNPSARRDFNKEISSTTVNGYLRIIKVFLQYCVDTRIVKENVATTIKQYKVKRTPKEDISDEQFRLLLNCMPRHTFSGYRDYILFQLLLDTGMRISETLALKIEDINLNNNTIFLSETITKGRKDRIVYFGSKMQRQLKRWLNYKDSVLNSNLIFCSNRANMMTASGIESNLRYYLQLARINKKITCHTFRNNFAKRYLAAGGSIYILSKLLGHSSVTVTENAYADLLQGDIKKNYISPLASMGGR
ncbi:integrase/recombinase XerD [Hathewaya proteolytica DSM 3090]|uniref:Integrase/recombinase XerD n=1 Tax=Hathewaya proteolytica DSM 3090 TaxID=1121331 RepID=A0A1M6L3N5_9CLOT|nr:tyrosine-type recombinase/integrase [Hathewaya proteolytica]SHJ65807.1 integrase/recombinase XerD [Hathewaya proteolytica DSM 3090]